MSITKTNRNFKNRGRDIKYLNKDFSDFRSNLIEFTKVYFPKTYSDFNESSPGMLFIELASYIGDSLSYYIDDTLKESLMVHAEDIDNVLALSQYLGYKPKVTSPAQVTLSVYQLVPSKNNGEDLDDTYFLRIKPGMQTISESGIIFITQDVVDFSNPEGREVSVYERDGETGDPTFYLLKKEVNAISATIQTKEVKFGSYEPFRSINIPDTNVIDIYDIRDSDNYKYYNVPYLGQELVYVDYPNIDVDDPEFAYFANNVPYVLKVIKTPKRFVHRINPDRTSTIQFGAADPTSDEFELIPNLKNVGLGLPNSIDRLNASFDPTNFLKTRTYGVSPSNTTITVNYMVGGGIESNVRAGSINKVTNISFDNDIELLNSSQLSIFNYIKRSVAVDNTSSASGGGRGDSLEEIRQNALANFGSQNRAVTDRDYKIRTLSMPSKYGSVAKVYATSDGSLDNNSPSSILASPNALREFTDLVLRMANSSNETDLTSENIQSDIKNFLVGKSNNLKEKNNPFAVNLYVLGYDASGHLTDLSRNVKENIKTYLSEHRMLTDGINIIDGFVINVGINFEITVLQNYNKSEVLLQCVRELQEYFDINKWDFNQTINLVEIELLLANLDGVSSIPKLEIVNKCSNNGSYSNNRYNILAATKNKIIYPSMDPSVFEVKYPNSDIRGRVL
jgi:hypothetical protein